MPILKEMLTEGDEVLVDTHPHFEFLLRPVTASVAALALFVAVQTEWKTGSAVNDFYWPSSWSRWPGWLSGSSSG